MRKSIAILILLLAPLSLLMGCNGIPSARPQIFTRNIPYHSTTVTVVNGTDGMVLDVIQDGRVVGQNIQTGDFYSVDLRDWSGQTSTVSLAVVGHHDGRMTGTTTRRFRVNGNRRDSETWVIRTRDLRR